MATKNGERTIESSIDSILSQSFTDFEFIIVNDNSSDKTEAIVNKISEIDDRIVLINNLEDPGLTSSLNIGLKRCQGEFVARMDDDDIASSGRITTELEYLEENSSVAIVGSNINYFDNNGVYGKSDFKHSLSKVDIWRGIIFANPTVMIRRSVFEKTGGYNESDDVIRVEDYDYWCKLYSKGFYGVNLDECLLNYREDKLAFKKRNNIRRWRLAKRMFFWRKRMNIPLYLLYVPLFELLKCLVPQNAIRMYHRIKYSDKSI
ncbi:glycosyltransferase family 2 protein [Pediococcus argentinicus]